MDGIGRIGVFSAEEIVASIPSFRLNTRDAMTFYENLGFSIDSDDRKRALGIVPMARCQNVPAAASPP